MAAGTEQGPLRVGSKFLNYTVQGLIGRGGHAWVYRAHNEFLDHHVAIKVLHRPSGVTKDMLRRGQAEAKLLFRLRHDNIVEVIDAGITDAGLLYIVMELLRGRSLRELLQDRGRLPLGTLLPMSAAIADGMREAHATKTIHRDLKPENIFVREDGQPKVLDFGIAKITDAAGWTTEKDILHGTLLYMSPEQLNGHVATACSDVYALGLVLYEAILGRHPCLLGAATPSVLELTRIQMTVRPPRLDELDRTVPRHVGRLVERMLAKLPDQRVASMSALGDALRECIRRCAADPDPRHSASVTPVSTPLNEPRDTDPVAPDTFFVPSGTFRPVSPAAPSPTVTGAPQAGPTSTKSLLSAPSARVPPDKPASGSGQKRAAVPASRRTAITPSTAPPVTTGIERKRAARAATDSGAARHELRRVILASVAIGGTASALLMIYLASAEDRLSQGADRVGTRTSAVTPAADASKAHPAPSSLTQPPVQRGRETTSTSADLPNVVAPPAPTIAPSAGFPARPTTGKSGVTKRPTAKSAATTAADRMQDRLRWLEEDLDDKARKPAKPSSSVDPGKDVWVQ